MKSKNPLINLAQIWLGIGLMSFSLLLTHCGVGGGGGGGGDGSATGDSGIAELELLADPNTIDSGDYTEVSLRLYDISEKKFIVKVRYPIALKYERNSTTLEFDEGPVLSLTPSNHERSSNGYEYLVFFLTQDRFGSKARGTIKFLLKGVQPIKDRFIEVDVDLNDPDVTDTREFEVEKPLFSSKVSYGIKVNQDPTPEPTVTATPTA